MQNEQSYLGEEGREKDAGEASLERSERSERSGSEASPAARPAAEGVSFAAPEGDPEHGELAAEGTLSPSMEADAGTGAAEGAPPADAEEAWEGPAPWIPNLTARRRGTLAPPTERQQPPLTPQQKLLLLDTWQRSGLPAGDFGAMVHISRHTLYAWKHRFEQQGPAGLMEQPRGVTAGSRLPELTKRSILMLKTAHPDWGCQRISDMLVRGPALPASPAAVARVLHEAGYTMEEQATHPHPPQVRSFERAKPNQLWQTDLFTFVLKRQNRRVYLVAFMDDHSRFITGYGLHASQSGALVLEVLRAAIAAYGVPAEILTDNGSQYVTWRGKSQFTRELEKLGVHQIVASPRRPQTLGKIERFWGSLWRECLESAVFLDLAEARQRIGLFIDYYNLQRPHQGIEGLVPADRFFYAAPEVLKTLKQRVAENARELARQGVPKPPFYLTGQVAGQPFSVHQEGDRVVLQRAGQERAEIELVPGAPPAASPSAPPRAPLPPVVCPDGSPATLFQHASTEWAPGTSALDPYFPVSDRLSAPPADGAGAREDDEAAPDEQGGDR